MNVQKFRNRNHLSFRERFLWLKPLKNTKTIISIYIWKDGKGGWGVEILYCLNNEHFKGHNELPHGSFCHLDNCIHTHLVRQDIFIVCDCSSLRQHHLYVISTGLLLLMYVWRRVCVFV